MYVSNEAPRFYLYDLETYINCFQFGGKFLGDTQFQQFEISSRGNQRDQLLQWLGYLQSLGVVMVGYNNLWFDYPIVHQLLLAPYTFDCRTAYNLAQQIITTPDGYGLERIRFNDRIIPQLDLSKVHHFDNYNKRTSLKSLQFAMRSQTVEDLPFDPHTELTHDQMIVMGKYNLHDITETEKFFWKSKPMIDIRFELLNNGVLSGDVLNYSDVKLGTEYLVKKIGRGKCYISGSTPRQTKRDEIDFRDVILPKIEYQTPEFNNVLTWFRSQRVFIKSDERPSLQARLANLDFHFGVGGVHASVESQVYESTDTHVIRDVDVSGMYPAVCIANGFAPEHLGKDFVTAYNQLSVDRRNYEKGSTMNLILKLANNGASGNLENPFSPLYDPKCAYQIRINGQLQIIQLAELLHMVPGVQLIQANTDGITAYVPREHECFFDLWCNEWECMTGLKLEHVPYKRMWIRDVNNYLAETMDGKIKRKGAYWYPITDSDYQGSSGSNWNKDFSNLSAPKGAEICLTRGHEPADVVRIVAEPFDFMLRYKTNGGAKVYIGDVEQQRTVRYYVSKCGQPMRKVAMPKGEIGTWKRRNKIKDDDYNRILNEIPPGAWDERIHTKNKSKYAMSVTGIESGRLVKQCNDAKDFNWKDLNYDYYEQEIRKLLL